MTSAAPWTGQQGWHRADWGAFGLAETVIKLIGIAVAVVAALGGGSFSVATDDRAAYWLLVATAVGYVLAVVDRLQDRELTAMVFWALMVVGHLAMVYAAGDAAWPRTAVVLFALAMAAGDAIKVGFFVITGARVRDLPRWLPIAMTGVLLVLYLAIVVLALA
ncbi:MAG: hypothetical protein AAF962_07480 [Actinomycetota bacterium]